MNQQFHKDIQVEIAKSKKQRIYIFIIALSISLLYTIANLFITDYGLFHFFDNPGTYFLIIGWHLLFIVYELLILFFVARYVSKNKGIPKLFILFNITNEITFPSILLGGIIYLEGKEILLDSPYYLIYFLVITLSALHLDLKISFFIGLVSALQYSLILFLSLHVLSGSEEYKILLPESVYVARIVLLLLAGGCAGFVGQEIKKRVQTSFNFLRERQQIENLFSQQVSREVVDALIKESNTSKKAEVTIMFLDIRDFTNFAENLDPQEVIDFQNKIFGPFIEIVNDYNGIINQIMGDGIMATFGSPIPDKKHTENAFLAGKSILRKLKELIENKTIIPTKIGIGLHTGKVITGNIGNEQRKQYSISGKTVIIAARIEQLNKKFESCYLISEAVYNNVKNLDPNIKNLGDEQLKGIKEEINVFQVA